MSSNARDKRKRTHMALEHYERGPAARRIRSARERLGLSDEAFAAKFGFKDWYHDLEAYDDDVFMAISLRQLGQLADALRLTPLGIVAPTDPPVVKPISMSDVVKALSFHMAQRSETPDSLSARVGWELAGALENAECAWNEWNVDCLQDVSREIEVSWMGVLASWPAGCAA